MLQGALFECCALTEPGTVQAVVLTTGLLLVVNKLGYCAEKSPGSVFGGVEFSTTAMAFKQGLHFLEGALIGKTWHTCTTVPWLICLADHLEEVVHGFMGFDFTLGQGLHAVYEAIPLAYGNTQLAFDGLGIEAGGVRYLDSPRSCTGSLQCNRQGIVADHTDRCRYGHSGQTSVA